MAQYDIPPEDKDILQSFDNLLQVKNCVDTILRLEKMKLETNRFYQKSLPDAKYNELYDTGGLVSSVVFYTISLTAFSPDNRYELNALDTLQTVSEFKPRSRECVRWLCENFSLEQQRSNWIMQEDGELLVRQYLKYQNSEQLSPQKSLIAALETITGAQTLVSGFDTTQFRTWIDRYGVLCEKRLLAKKVSVVPIQDIAEKQRPINKI